MKIDKMHLIASWFSEWQKLVLFAIVSNLKNEQQSNTVLYNITIAFLYYFKNF